MRRINIAIDGFSSCGKSTLAKQLAHHLHYAYIDSGAMYRAIALYVIENGLVVDGKLDKASLLRVLDRIHIGFKHDDATQRSATWLDGHNVEHRIRGMEVSRHVTLVSPVPEVRAKLVELDELAKRIRRMKRALELGLRCGCLRVEDCTLSARDAGNACLSASSQGCCA